MNAGELEAKKLLERMAIKNPPVPVEKIAESLGARIVFKPASDGEEDVSGMLYRSKERVVIGVNSAHHLHRQRFTIAHEIGHLVLHQGEMYIDTPSVKFRDSKSGLAIDNEEIEANGFAAELLMPREFLEKSLENLYKRNTRETNQVVENLSVEYKVSPQMVEYRLRNLGVFLPE